MTKRIVEIGAPSITGKSACVLCAEAFADAAFPLTIEVKNHMPRAASFPEVGLFLGSTMRGEQKSTGRAVVSDPDLLTRFASSIEQVATLNRYKLAVTIAEVDESGEQEPAGEAAGEAAGESQASGEPQGNPETAANPEAGEAQQSAAPPPQAKQGKGKGK
jgi:predicted nucleotidyltransferase